MEVSAAAEQYAFHKYLTFQLSYLSPLKIHDFVYIFLNRRDNHDINFNDALLSVSFRQEVFDEDQEQENAAIKRHFKRTVNQIMDNFQQISQSFYWTSNSAEDYFINLKNSLREDFTADYTRFNMWQHYDTILQDAISDNVYYARFDDDVCHFESLAKTIEYHPVRSIYIE